MKIGAIDIKGKLFLAPMSGLTSLPFRLMCKRHGAALVYSEMINADAFIYENPKTRKRAYFVEQERPIGIQLMGSDISKLRKAVLKIEKELKPDLIDINIGCPAYNIMKTGSGASLLKDLNRLGKLVKTLSTAIKIPLTCKIRITNDNNKTLEIAKIIEKSGAKALTVHGRTARQAYSGEANWDIIKQIKKELSIPVILNGDVIDEISAKKGLETNCDAVMIGRAAVGNPFIFKRINYYLETGNLLEKQTLKDKISLFLDFVKICKKYNYDQITTIKVQAQSFIKGFSGCRQLRNSIAKSKNIDEITKILKNI